MNSKDIAMSEINRNALEKDVQRIENQGEERQATSAVGTKDMMVAFAEDPGAGSGSGLTMLEAREFVKGVYPRFLGREADASGLIYWATALVNGDVNFNDVENMIAASSEAQAYTRSLEQVVHAIYQQELGRTAEPSGLAGWVAQLRAHGGAGYGPYIQMQIHDSAEAIAYRAAHPSPPSTSVKVPANVQHMYPTILANFNAGVYATNSLFAGRNLQQILDAYSFYLSQATRFIPDPFLDNYVQQIAGSVYSYNGGTMVTMVGADGRDRLGFGAGDYGVGPDGTSRFDVVRSAFSSLTHESYAGVSDMGTLLNQFGTRLTVTGRAETNLFLLNMGVGYQYDSNGVANQIVIVRGGWSGTPSGTTSYVAPPKLPQFPLLPPPTPVPSPSQQAASNAGYGSLSAAAAAEWFPVSGDFLDPVVLGDGWVYNPKSGKLLMPNVSVIRDTRLQAFLQRESGQAASFNAWQFLSAADVYGPLDDFIAVTQRLVLANHAIELKAMSLPPSDNYDYENALAYGLLKSQRVERAITVLSGKKDQLLSAGVAYGIDPRAIAAAITWEFSQNSGGFLSDLFLPAYFQNGYGWGQIHNSTLMNEMVRDLTLGESIQLRKNLDSAISLVAARMDQQAKTYKGISGIDLRNNVPALAWIYNASQASIETSARNKYADILAGRTPNLQIINSMAKWTSDNVSSFGFATPAVPVPATGIPYTSSPIQAQ